MTTKKTPKTHYGPSPCGYGRFLAKTSSRRTQNPADVTCGACQRRIAHWGLQPRTDFPDLPTFNVVAGERYDAPHVGCTVSFRCPVCGRVNTHGRPGGTVGGGDGHRVAHCDCWSNGYVIREVTA
jgi:hypothetical protein